MIRGLKAGNDSRIFPVQQFIFKAEPLHFSLPGGWGCQFLLGLVIGHSDVSIAVSVKDAIPEIIWSGKQEQLVEIGRHSSGGRINPLVVKLKKVHREWAWLIRYVPLTS
jgi:hypothetical protein